LGEFGQELHLLSIVFVVLFFWLRTVCWVLEEEISELFRFVKGKCVGFFKEEEI
jgi:hypothetical protein